MLLQTLNLGGKSMTTTQLGIAAFAAVAFLGTAFAQAASASFSNESRTAAASSIDANKVTDDNTYWSTEGSGYCATGNFKCSSGREIGCQATGAYVKCEYTKGDVGWVRCQGKTDTTNTVFEDQCP